MLKMKGRCESRETEIIGVIGWSDIKAELKLWTTGAHSLSHTPHPLLETTDHIRKNKNKVNTMGWATGDMLNNMGIVQDEI